jgi:2-keto-4-pentenoate hydratase/2-oxohepta-3-ene-1,7-dioic acid hydratase in catechol pathway
VTFALGTFGAGFPGLVLGDRVVDLSDQVASTRELFEDWDASFAWLSERAEQGGGVRLDGLQVLPPVEPRQILQSGANYYKHVIDLGVAQGVGSKPGMSPEDVREEVTRIMDARAATGEPYLFLGAFSSLCGAYDDIVLPAEGDEHDWELELTAVIGGPEPHVAGYTISNDLTTRDRLYRPDLGPIGTDWVRSKSAPTFLPTGPFIVPAAFVDPSDLRITLRLNDDAMQDESTSDMIFGIDRLLAYAAQRVRLLPGDLLLTGSPAGNGSHWGRFLREGDVMEGSITGLGTQRNRVTR